MMNKPRRSQIRHKEELKHINERYDALKAVKERAAERYKADFKKWREFSKWLFAENEVHRKRRNEVGISKEEKKRRDLASIMRKREKMIELGPDLAQFEGEIEGVACLKLYFLLSLCSVALYLIFQPIRRFHESLQPLVT